jgi:hypothetical protein
LKVERNLHAGLEAGGGSSIVENLKPAERSKQERRKKTSDLKLIRDIIGRTIYKFSETNSQTAKRGLMQIKGKKRGIGVLLLQLNE